MGRLLYGPQEREVEIDDRALAHVQIVIVGKLRRAESFTFTWTAPDGEGRVAIWLHPAIPVQFQFDRTATERIDAAWLKALSDSAARGDLQLSQEPKAT
ncbi:hypothetical protein ACEXQD_11615 [Herbiconiux sp. P15]|uniref:DUF7882 family protein n=1 Tax=Herbiconiux liukaitaii TaxID=3342799 RepID=UPI0035B827CE